jgi:hypothetical protein
MINPLAKSFLCVDQFTRFTNGVKTGTKIRKKTNLKTLH